MEPQGVDPYVQQWVAKTNGNLYRQAVNRLPRLPIPRWPGPVAEQAGGRLLDIGCGWGRWMVAAARAGYLPLGIDLKLLSAAAANRILRSEDHAGHAMVGDIRRLPFPDESFDAAFSYSVLQHLPKVHALAALREIRRVLKPGGYCQIELPLHPGLTNWRHESSSNIDSECWDVRYYRWQEVQDIFGALFEDVEIQADCIFGIGVKFEDLDILPWRYKPIAIVSEGFRKMCEVLPQLVRLADSVYIVAQKRSANGSDRK